ncbi:MAG TPA: hypothetical protein VD866_17075 [Urbifossiella sp.]|nr:hypothetical protein [Urbifossiella sp.]
MEYVALTFLAATALQVGVIVGGLWLFQEPEKWLTRRKGLGPGLAIYTAASVLLLVASEVGGVIVAGLLWWVFALMVLELNVRQTLKIGIASAIIFWTLAASIPAPDPLPEPEGGVTKRPF